MAIQTGTATDHKDLLNLLHTFLTGLVSNPWTANRFTSSDELFLQGQGSSGTDEIYCSIKIDESVPSDYFNWRVAGAIGYSSTNDQANQPGASQLNYMALWDGSIPYWFIANGRRFIVIAKVSTTYHALYMGFILPYATPSEYPYPLFIGGETSFQGKRWSVTDENNRCFWDPGESGSWLYRNDGQWLDWVNFGGTSTETIRTNRNVMPYVSDADNFRSIGTGKPPGGEYPLIPTVLIERSPTEAIMGEFEGVFAVSGFGNASENTVDIGGDDHLVVQNIFRTDRWDYAAIKLV